MSIRFRANASKFFKTLKGDHKTLKGDRKTLKGEPKSSSFQAYPTIMSIHILRPKR